MFIFFKNMYWYKTTRHLSLVTSSYQDMGDDPIVAFKLGKRAWQRLGSFMVIYGWFSSAENKNYGFCKSNWKMVSEMAVGSGLFFSTNIEATGKQLEHQNAWFRKRATWAMPLSLREPHVRQLQEGLKMSQDTVPGTSSDSDRRIKGALNLKTYACQKLWKVW